MAIVARKVKSKKDANGVATGRAGTVYDVFRKINGKTHGKRGFLTRKEAHDWEAALVTKHQNPAHPPTLSPERKQPMKDYLPAWLEIHGKANLRPSTFASYKGHIANHLLPHIGNVRLNQLTPATIDGMLQKLLEQGLSQSTVRYAHRVLSVALEAARKYHYIEDNPARDIITKFGKQGKTPDPYTIAEMRRLMAIVAGTEFEAPVVLSGLYGLRISEDIGLRNRNVDLENLHFSVVEQMPFDVPAGAKTVDNLPPPKSNDGVLPITEVTLPYFTRQHELQARQKNFTLASGGEYYGNDLFLSKPDGAPLRRDRLSANFGQFLRRHGMRHIRFHDLRHSCATNCHALTGDFYTVSAILRHSLKGIGIQLGISTNLESETARYIDVGLERMREVLDIYHKAVLGTDKSEATEEHSQESKNDTSSTYTA